MTRPAALLALAVGGYDGAEPRSPEPPAGPRVLYAWSARHVPGRRPVLVAPWTGSGDRHRAAPLDLLEKAAAARPDGFEARLVAEIASGE